jgi:uncharacterized membrane protein YgaE (UPF0421/DUF939 family)
MNERIKSLLIYAGKCVTGTLIVFTVSNLLHYEDMAWALISVILVLSPDGKDSVSLAVTRIKANVVGAAAGVLCLLIAPATMWTISLAIALTMTVCYWFKLDAGIRSALAASIIVMLHVSGKHLWDSALERVIAVLAGCALGLTITFIFHFKIKNQRRVSAEQAE